MVKFLTIAVALTILSYFLTQHSAFGQTATPTDTPTPTMTATPTTAVPTGAPATGFGPY